MVFLPVLMLLLILAAGCLSAAAWHLLPAVSESDTRGGRTPAMVSGFLPRKPELSTAREFIRGWSYLRPKVPRHDDAGRHRARHASRCLGVVCFPDR